jgi:hypothetical protein
MRRKPIQGSGPEPLVEEAFDEADGGKVRVLGEGG